jgi:hypothetical protein
MAAVFAEYVALEVEAAFEGRILRIPGERHVVRVAGGDRATRPTETTHLHQRSDRVGKVVEHLMSVDHVEDRVRHRQPVNVTDSKLHVGDTLCLLTGRCHHLAGTVDADHSAGGHPAGKVDRDRAGAAADVEHVGRWDEAVEEVGGRVGRSPPPMRSQDTLVMAVGVALTRFGHAARMPQGRCFKS